MADFSMYGPKENGVRLFQQDLQKEEMNNLDMQFKQMQIQQQQQKLQQAQTETQQKAMYAQRLQERMGKDEALNLQDVGQDLLKSGMLKEGANILAKAAQIDQTFAQRDNARAAAQQKEIGGQQKILETLIPAIEQAHSQEDYNKVLDMAEGMYGRKFPQQFRDAPWTPDFKQRLLDIAGQAKVKQKESLNQAKIDNIRSQVETRERVNDIRIEEIKARTKAIDLKAQRDTKNGGANRVTTIPKSELNAALNLMKADFPDLKEEDPASINASYYVAGLARRLLNDNKGLDQGTALQQAYMQARQEGLISEEITEHWWPREDEKGMKFKTKEAPKEAAPKVKTPSAPPAALDYLKAHPELKAQFKAKYGYLPEGQ